MSGATGRDGRDKQQRDTREISGDENVLKLDCGDGSRLYQYVGEFYAYKIHMTYNSIKLLRENENHYLQLSTGALCIFNTENYGLCV